MKFVRADEVPADTEHGTFYRLGATSGPEGVRFLVGVGPLELRLSRDAYQALTDAFYARRDFSRDGLHMKWTSGDPPFLVLHDEGTVVGLSEHAARTFLFGTLDEE